MHPSGRQYDQGCQQIYLPEDFNNGSFTFIFSIMSPKLYLWYLVDNVQSQILFGPSCYFMLKNGKPFAIFFQCDFLD